jgi:hypothetical protein
VGIVPLGTRRTVGMMRLRVDGGVRPRWVIYCAA